MESIDFVSLIPFVFITTFTPGPNNIACTSMAINFGLKRSMGFLYGIFFGFVSVLLLAGFFSNILLKTIPDLEPIMRWIGAVYILYLAYNILKADYSFQQDNQQVQPFSFSHGFLLQFLNPKGIIYALTLYSAFLYSIIDIPRFIVLFAFILSSIGFLSLLLWASFGTLISRFLYQDKVRKTVNLLLAVLLAYTAVKLTGIIL
ncbi:MAG TPA: LysE family transporter [Atribacterota bacterium]|nr:LysE family transporter [Atribacterota bacterium]